MSRKFFFGLTLAFLLAFVSSPKLRAQELNVAQVTGQVVDSSGAVVPGGTVKLIETDKGVAHTATTDASGNYILPGLPPGPYRLEVDKTGFKTYVQTGIVLQVSDHVTLNATLEVGAASETVEVSATGPLVQTETAAISTVMESQRIADLPLNGRQITDLIIFSGASAMAPGGDERGSKSFYSSVTISVAGGQSNGTNYLLDGGDYNDTMGNVNNPYPFPDALQEFSTETSALPARNGVHPGGVVNAVTKSGTNSVHGDAFEFYRDGNFNADGRNFLLNQPGAPDALIRSQFGGDMGGPFVRDKLFWFGGYQGTRQHENSPNHTFTTVTDKMLSGDFTDFEAPACTNQKAQRLLGGPFGGTDKTPDAGQNKVSTSFDPVVAQIFLKGYMPIEPDATDPCGQLVYTRPSITNEDQLIGRVDFVKSEKQSLYGRYLLDDARIPAPFDIHDIALSSLFAGNWELFQGATLGHTYTFSPTFVNSFHAAFNYRRDNRATDPGEINWTTLATGAGVSNPQSAFYQQYPHFLLFSVSSGFNVGCGTCAPGFFNISTAQFADDVDWIAGAHHFAFGADYLHTINDTLTGYDANGTFSFTGKNVSVNGDGMPDFLVGTYYGGGTTGFTQSHPQEVAYRESIASLYFQDTYKIRRNLTLEAGLRWEPTFQPYDQFYRGSSFSMADFIANIHTSVYTKGVSCPGSATVPCPPAGMLYHGDPGVPPGFTTNHLANFSPRLGIAWDPTGRGTQSIRAGYGILYDSTMVWYSQRLTSNPPFVDQIDVPNKCGTFSNPWQNYPACAGGAGTGSNPFLNGGTGLIFPAATAWGNLRPHMRPMYSQEWNVSYERQFAKEWAFSVAYLGNHAVHIPLSYDGNYILDDPSVCAEYGTHTYFTQTGLPGGCENITVSKNGSGQITKVNINPAFESQRRLLFQTEGCNGLTNCTPTTTPEPANYGSGVGTIYQALDTGHSAYKALFVKLEHPFKKGMDLNVNYTYSRCQSLGDFNGDLRGSYFLNNEVGTPGVFNSDYGDCNFDIRHLLNVTMVVQSPFRGHGFSRWLLGGWQFAPDIHYQSGWPVDTSLGDVNGITGSRPELTGQPIYGNNQAVCTKLAAGVCTNIGYQYINPAAFADPVCAIAAPATNCPTTAPFPEDPGSGAAYDPKYITVPRDFLRSPGQFNIDAQISRTFPMGERLRWDIRFEAFNAINHVNLQLAGIGGNYNPVTGTGAIAGTSTSQRILEAAVKLHF